MKNDFVADEIVRAIWVAIDGCMNRIGSVIDGDARRLIIEKGIKDRGDFYQNSGYAVTASGDSVNLAVGSNVKHEPYVLGGKVPSWTPLAPLKAWVERKNLNWTDKVSGKELSVEQMAYMIRGKIKREGIAARNVFDEVIRNKEAWIYSQLQNIEVAL